MHDTADSQLSLRSAETRKAIVVIGEEPVKSGNGMGQQKGLGSLVNRVNER